MSRTPSYRKHKAVTALAPNSLVRSSVAEFMQKVGILDQSYFSRMFEKEFGVRPSEYSTRKKGSQRVAFSVSLGYRQKKRPRNAVYF